MSIPFTQFLMPDGRRRSITIDRPAPIEDLAKQIIAAGFRFEIEMLQTGQVSMEIVKDVPDPGVADSVAIEICHNGPTEGDNLGVPDAVDKMIQYAAKRILRYPMDPGGGPDHET